ncbi:MAG TPA: macro domain-containing protein [Solirubrobacteraceae bacterium]|nr:macro domain-containing protein [Solirubrobacteraceae bacterium]
MSTIEHRKGNLLAADAEALVNTVNTVGVMGKGIALQFRKAFPDNYRAYQRACRHNELKPGSMLVFETSRLGGPRLVINFPTKRHWRGKSRMEYIDAGLADLARILRHHQVRSVAIPPLGCGNGGLPWSEVRPKIEAALKPLPDIRIALYAPGPPPPVHQQRTATKRPRMTRGRAALIAVFASYRRDPTSTLTMLVAQKLAYLLQTTGEPLKLNFVKADYGPYAEVLNHALQNMDGHFIEGYGDRTTKSDLRLLAGAVTSASTFLANDDAVGERTRRVSKLIEGLESPFGLELLTTVHWAATREGARSPQEATQVVADWTPRKREVFGEREVTIAWERLRQQGWLDAGVAVPTADR